MKFRLLEELSTETNFGPGEVLRAGTVFEYTGKQSVLPMNVACVVIIVNGEGHLIPTRIFSAAKFEKLAMVSHPPA